MNYVEETMKQTGENKPGKAENGILQQLLKIDKRVAIIMAVDSMTAGIDTVSIKFIKVFKTKNNKYFKSTDCFCDHWHPLLSCKKSRQARKITKSNFKSVCNFRIKC